MNNKNIEVEMKRVLISTGLFCMALNAVAKKAPEHITDLLPTPETRQSNVSDIDIFMGGLHVPVSGNTVEEKAMAYIQQSDISKRTSSLTDLKHAFSSRGKASTTVRFKQYMGQWPVYGSDLAVTVNDKGAVVFVAGELKMLHNIADQKTNMTSFLANDIARNFLGFSSQAEVVKAETVVYISPDAEGRLAHRFIMNDQVSRPGEWEVLVAADNADILVAKDISHYAQVTGTASAFDPDPLSSSGSTYGDSGYVDGGDSNTSELQAQVYDHDVILDKTGSIYTLKSNYAEIIDHESPFDGLFTQNNANFVSVRSDNQFEASNVYFHIDNYMRYLNEDLGVNVMPFQYSGGVQFDPHGMGGDDNSHYTTGNGRLAFGEGCVDDSEDADVIIHELGHGLHDWVTGGSLSQNEGLSEGTGDYFANSYARTRPDFKWTSEDDEYYWVFSWDGHNTCWSGRSTNVAGVYPNNLTGGIHSDGQVWSTCLMKVWDQLGPEVTDTIVLEGLRMTGSNTNQEEAAQAVVQAAFNLNYMSQLAVVESTFQSCGYQIDSLFVDLIFADGFE